MAHYAFIDENNVVVEVIVGRDEDEVVDGISDWEEYYSTKRQGLRCLRTSYNTYNDVYLTQDGEPHEDQSKAFRGNFASKGMIYDEQEDIFTWPSS